MPRFTKLLIAALILFSIYETGLLLLISRKEQTYRIQLSSQAITVSQERNYYQSVIKKSDQLIESLKKTLAAEIEGAKTSQEKTSVLEEKLKVANDTTANLNKEIEEEKKLKREAEEKSGAALRKLQESEKSKLLLVNEIKQLKGERVDKNKELAKLEKRIGKFDLLKDNLSKEKKYLVKKVAKSRSDRIRLSKELGALKAKQQSMSELTTANRGFGLQIAQLLDILIGKDSALHSIEQERDNLRGEVSRLQSRGTALQNQINQAQSDQAKVAKLLAEIAKLNEALEEKLTGPYQDTGNKEKTNKLKRKVDIILMPEENHEASP
ncbi:MAG: hypothetical protein ABIH27_04205 [Candidatus Omnitrophota bacterium]